MSNERASLEDLYVVVRLNQQGFAVPVSMTREMVAMPPVTKVPKAPGYVRGVINLRGKVLPLMDLRLRLGMVSCLAERDETVQLMHEREEDHLKWLEELRASVEEGREFTLTTDPKKCAFGKWYYSYLEMGGTNQCTMMEGLLARFEEPHNRIHQVGEEVAQHLARGENEEAIKLIERTRETTLAEMIDLFQKMRVAIAEETREIALVLGSDSGRMSVAVDMVDSVEKLELENLPEAQRQALGLTEDLVAGIGRRGRQANQETVLILNLESLLADTNLAAA